jgi:GNAT superfamily N-acetyltransferase
MKLNEYLLNPCGSLSIPFWKMQRINTPKNIKIVHDRSFSSVLLNNYNDTCYFRLKHDLVNINSPEILTDYSIKTLTKNHYSELVDLINISYISSGIKVNLNQIINWTKTEVHESNLWISIYHNKQMVGAIIADFDSNTKEAIIEWLQILPDYRRKGLASIAVNECLNRIKDKAAFATVSGELNNQNKPETVYRKCGFTGDDIWHILIKK